MALSLLTCAVNHKCQKCFAVRKSLNAQPLKAKQTKCPSYRSQRENIIMFRDRRIKEAHCNHVQSAVCIKAQFQIHSMLSFSPHNEYWSLMTFYIHTQTTAVLNSEIGFISSNRKVMRVVLAIIQIIHTSD